MDKIELIIEEVTKIKSSWKYEQAIKFVEEMLVKFNNDYRLYEEIADIYLSMSDRKKAEKAVNFALTMKPDSASGNYLKWFILLSKWKIDEALILLEKSNKSMPNNPEVLRNLWWAYNMNWEITRWIAILKRALLLSPNDPLIIEDLAITLINNWDILEWNNLLHSIWKEYSSN